MRLSVVIITFNEEKNLERCLQSVKQVADEIVVLDSYSTDKTKSIALAFGARFLEAPFTDFVSQKNNADAAATHDWILSLDADEALDDTLLQTVIQLKQTNHSNNTVFQINRLTNYCGTWIKHCGWYPDKKIRLYQKSAGAWTGNGLHEGWTPFNKNLQIIDLNGLLLHYSYYTYSDHLKQIEKYSEMAAKIAVKQGKNVSLLKWLFAPGFRFFADYIIRLGFLDGLNGYMVCKLSSWAAFVKYSKIRQYHKDPELLT